MNAERYTPGHSQDASRFMAMRSFESHGMFFEPYLAPGLDVLDCGCGPGSISIGMAQRVAPGSVIGVDAAASQVNLATETARGAGMHNIRFEVADCYSLPFGDAAFDRGFSHALIEHLARPLEVIRECHRVLNPGGIIGLCCPDWGGFILSPSDQEIEAAIAAYQAMQIRNGGDVYAGRKLAPYVEEAGFHLQETRARYECYPSIVSITSYLAFQLEQDGQSDHAGALRRWGEGRGRLFAQTWISAVGIK